MYIFNVGDIMKDKEIVVGQIWNKEKVEGVKEAILEHKRTVEAEDWMPWERYLLWLGERSIDYSYTKDVVFEHLEYFKEGWLNHTNPYYMLEFFSFNLDDKIEVNE